MASEIWQGAALMAAIAVGAHALPVGKPIQAAPVIARAQLEARATDAPPTYDFDRECAKHVLPADVAEACAQRQANGISVLGVVVSLFAGGFLLIQVTQSERFERNRVRKKHLASRATLPVLLSEITEFCDAAKDSLRPMFGAVENDGAVAKDRAHFDLPHPPANLVPKLLDAIEAASREDLEERLADIASTYQLCMARLKALKQGLANPNHLTVHANLVQHIIEIASLRALAASLYKYVRRETERLDPYNFDAVMYELRSMYFIDHTGGRDDIDGLNYRAAASEIDRRQKAGQDPYIFNLGDRAARPNAE